MSVNTVQKKPRNLAIDMIKAAAILFVVIGHCIQYGNGAGYFSAEQYYNNWLFKVIYSFHMPLFMLISGFLFEGSVHKLTVGKNIWKRVQTLVIPILIWSIIPVGIEIVNSLKGGAGIQVMTWIKSYASHVVNDLWFLWAVFFCSIIVILVNRFLKDNVFVYCILFAGMFFIPDSFNLHLYKYMYFFFILGYMYKKNGLNVKWEKYYDSWITLLISGALFVGLIFLFDKNCYIYTSKFSLLRNGQIDFMQLGIDGYRYLIGLVGSVFVILLICKLAKVLPEKVQKCIAVPGAISLGIYILSVEVLNPLIKLVPTFENNMVRILVLIGETIVVMGISIVFVKLVQKSKILNKLLLGGR